MVEYIQLTAFYCFPHFEVPPVQSVLPPSLFLLLLISPPVCCMNHRHQADVGTPLA